MNDLLRSIVILITGLGTLIIILVGVVQQNIIQKIDTIHNTMNSKSIVRCYARSVPDQNSTFHVIKCPRGMK